MTKDPSTGLVVSGGLQRQFLSRMPALLEQLGPVKASSFRVARQIANTLHAGYAISHYSALEACKLIWIAVPETTLERVVRDLTAQMPVHRTMVVLCNMARDSSWPNALRAAGARMATVNQVGEGRESVLMGEGHADTLRAARKVLGPAQHRFVEIRPYTKAIYFAGISLSTQLLLPWIDASTGCLRAAGLARSQATELVASLSAKIMRAYASGGQKAWNRGAEAALHKSANRDAERLASIDPRLGQLYGEGVRLALAHFGGAPGSKRSGQP